MSMTKILHLGRRELAANAGSRHFARKGLRAWSSSTFNSKDVALGSPRGMPSTDNFKINTAVVRPDRHQDSVSAMANTLRNQEIHMETSLVEMKRQSGTPCWRQAQHHKELVRRRSARQLVVHLHHLWFVATFSS
jgi:hypothetical protein